jgi:IS4 transposase
VPTRATLTDHHAAETRVLRQSLAADKLYVLDRGYADYGLLAAILDARSSFLVRLPRSAVTEVLEERPLDAEARRRGVVRDVVVTLGCASSPELHGRQLRLVEVRVRDLGTLLGRPRRVVDRKTKLFRTAKAEHVLLLVTDRLDLDAALVADLYRYRWQIELFFRWFKTILRANRLLSLSQNGMTLVVYCGLIASLLITLWTNRKPTKRTYEMICLYLMGWAGEDEVEAHLERLDAASL